LLRHCFLTQTKTLWGDGKEQCKFRGRELVLIVDLAAGSGAGWQGSITIAGLGIKGAPLADIAVKSADGFLNKERVD
jgi:hypothetical protein